MKNERKGGQSSENCRRKTEEEAGKLGLTRDEEPTGGGAGHQVRGAGAGAGGWAGGRAGGWGAVHRGPRHGEEKTFRNNPR